MNRGKMTGHMGMDMQRAEVDGISTDPVISKTKTSGAGAGGKKNMQPNVEMPLRCPIMCLNMLCLTWKPTGKKGKQPYLLFQGGNRQNAYASAEKELLDDPNVKAALDAAGCVQCCPSCRGCLFGVFSHLTCWLRRVLCRIFYRLFCWCWQDKPVHDWRALPPQDRCEGRLHWVGAVQLPCTMQAWPVGVRDA